MVAPMQPQPQMHMAPSSHAVAGSSPQGLPPGAGYVTVTSAGVTHAHLMQHPGTPQHAILGQHHPHPITFTPGAHPQHPHHHLPMARLQRPISNHTHHNQPLANAAIVNGAIVPIRRHPHPAFYTHQSPQQHHLSPLIIGAPRKGAPIALPIQNGKGVNGNSVAGRKDSKAISGSIFPQPSLPSVPYFCRMYRYQRLTVEIYTPNETRHNKSSLQIYTEPKKNKTIKLQIITQVVRNC